MGTRADRGPTGRNETRRGTGAHLPLNSPATILGKNSSLIAWLAEENGILSLRDDRPLMSIRRAHTWSASMGISIVTSARVSKPGGGFRFTGNSSLQRRELKLKAKSESGSSYLNFKR